MPSLLDIQNLSLTIHSPKGKTPILDGISLVIEKSEKIGLVGPSGCGKSMTLKAILGLVQGVTGLKQSGEVIYKGQVISDGDILLKIRNQEIGLVFQQSSQVLNPSQRVGDQLLEKLQLFNKNSPCNGGKNVQKKSIYDLLDEVDLRPSNMFYDKYPFQLSGGQVQRCLIALALINDPQLLLADEPLSALDHTTQQSILGLLWRLNEDRGLAIMLVSHDLELVSGFCDRIINMEAGRIIEAEPGQEATLPAVQANSKTESRGGMAQNTKVARSKTPHPPNGLTLTPPRPYLQVRQLSKAYKKQSIIRRSKSENNVLDNYNLDLYKGEILGLFGPSGSGKSTLARLLARLDSPHTGSIHFNGEDITQFNSSRLKRYRRECQIIFQDPMSSMPPHRPMRALFEDVYWVLGRAYAQAEVYGHLEALGLDRGLLERLPHQLSGGQRQRMMIARALLIGAEFLICDEILASLDTAISYKILDQLKALVAQHNLTILFISHDEKLLEGFCDRVVEMPVVDKLS